MSCPACGGTFRRLTAPGRFHCTSQRLEWGPGPDGQPSAYLETCGERYGDGAPLDGLPLCGTCTTFAVRYCARCHAPMCDDHSAGSPAQWLCIACRADRIRGEEAEAARRREADAAERRAALARYRSLPALDRPGMAAYLDGTRDVADGTTHQIWDWTNRDVAAVLVSDLGLHDPVPVPARRGEPETFARRLHPDGSVTEDRLHSRGSSEYAGHYTETVTVEQPDDRFSTFPHTKRLAELRHLVAEHRRRREEARQAAASAAFWRTLVWVVALVFLGLVALSIYFGVAG